MTIDKHLDFSILIPTYNRGEVCRETVEAMTRVDREGVSVEFVVIDNNRTDNTRGVGESFADRLPVLADVRHGLLGRRRNHYHIDGQGYLLRIHIEPLPGKGELGDSFRNKGIFS